MPDTLPELPDLFRAEGVLFDLDGVLTPTAEVHMRAWRVVFDDVFARWGIDAAVHGCRLLRLRRRQETL